MNVISINSPNIKAVSSSTARNAVHGAGSLKVSSSKGRFDTFNLVGADEKYINGADVKSLDFKAAELVRNMSKLSEEEKAELAYGSYLEMAKAIGGMKEAIEYDITCFSEYKEEKAYYTNLLKNGGKIGEGGGQYKFGGNVKGDTVKTDDIKAALSEVQSHIDAWCGKKEAEKPEIRQLPEGVYGIFTHEVGYRIAEKVFRLSANVFSAATGINDSALDLKDNEFFFGKDGVTEENFLEKANTMLSAVKGRIKQLGNIMSEYSHNNRYLTDRVKERHKDRIGEMFDSEYRDLGKSDMHQITEKYGDYLFKSLDMAKNGKLSENRNPKK